MIIPLTIHLAMSCANHLVADDPYQYEELTTDELVTTWIAHEVQNQKIPGVLRAEVVKRLAKDDTTAEDRIILTTLMAHE